MSQMIKNKKLLSSFLTLGLVSVSVLSSCNEDKTNPDYPADQLDKIVTVTGDSNIVINDVAYNTNGDYYKNLTETNKRILDHILDNVVTTYIRGEDGNVKPEVKTALSEEQIKEKAEIEMVNKVNTGAYDVNYVFNEEKFINALNKEEMNIIDKSVCSFDKEVVITPNSKFEDIFTSCVDGDVYKTAYDVYSKYIDLKIKPSIVYNQLVTEYLYDEKHSNIESSQARDVSIIKLEDPDDENAGAARIFIGAFLADLNEGEGEKAKYGLDKVDLNVIGEAYKGNTAYAGVTKFFELHPELKTKTGKQAILNDMAKIATNSGTEEEPVWELLPKNKIDDDIFSTYTGSSTYSISEGYKRQLNVLSQKKNYIDGLHLSSKGIDNISDELKTRIFSTNYNTDPNSTKADITKTINGVRLLTKKDGQNTGDDLDNLIFFDSSSKCYYLCQINDIVNTSTIRIDGGDSEEVVAKKDALAAKTAYLMVDNSSYRSDAYVHYLKKFDIKYNNETFFEYMKSTYPSLFEEDED